MVDEVVSGLFERSRRIVAQDRYELGIIIAGHRIRIAGAGPAMVERIRPAFAHLPQFADGLSADLTVYLWDTASTGEPYPELGFPEVERHATGVLASAGALLAYSSVERTITASNRVTNEAVMIAGDAGLLPAWERPCPLRTLFSWWFVDHGKLLAHSAAVSTDEGAVLLVGPGGSGKSSTALACVAAGMGYLGDDYVLIDPQTQTVWSLYSSAKLVAEHLDNNPGLMTADGMIQHEGIAPKQYGWPGLEFPDRMRLSAPIRAVTLPVVTRGPECRLVASTPARALLALAPTTMFQSTAVREEAFRLSSDVVRPYAPYRLELGEGVDRVPGLLRDLIAAGGTRGDQRHR